ncbi:WD40/YVTN/BNR-like repeat-containing protein [Pseudomarimonas arenosa]|uniref:Photosynthesis system II assembly factor Ycf48/Hcf136-like domain-containing protein n=1 Tax=Pseudomarimonas arenosa TaxID=2774145 RepID=A0AAW3ZG89_9GAMM|nr:YCF48-related protein [Pseudomarimonas arenosa]MBD8525138.1 hypothetical protein [Pseudomarimonas arenosa]
MNRILSKHGWVLLTAVVAQSLVMPLAVAADDGEKVQVAEMLPLVGQRSLVLDITEAASRGVMVGERGQILVSESRTDWRQVEGVPTRATLTAVAAQGDNVWAVGHDGMILHSADGGMSWTVQRSDPKREIDPDEEWDPRQGAPLLDVFFVSELEGFAIGAYSLLLKTEDGGQNWRRVSVGGTGEEEAMDETDELAEEEDWTFTEDDLVLEEEENPHLNAIARAPSGLMLMVGERGAAFRSRDGGDTWERIQLPYGGSMFGLLALGDQHFVAFGLRGHILETTDGGDTWETLDTDTELSLMGGAALQNGGFVVVGANGVVISRESAQADLVTGVFVNEERETPVLASVLPRGMRTFLVTGEKGIGQYEVKPAGS